ncbi:flagellar M-ring protein FliF C-terminal domain-containing protein, partial [Xanthomonas sacchari]
TSNSPGSAPGQPGATGAPPAAGTAGTQQAAAATPTESSKSATRNYELDRTLQHTRQPAGRIKRVSVAVLVDHVMRPGAKGKMTEQALSAAELTRIEGLVKQAVGFNAERGDTVSVMNAPFVRQAPEAADKPGWWEDPRVMNVARLVLGAAVVLALLFGVLRPALRQIAGPAPAAAVGHDRDGNEPRDAKLSMLDDDNPLLPSLGEDTASLSGGAGGNPAIALPDAYEERLRQAREAVKQDSKRVAQVVKGWVASEA